MWTWNLCLVVAALTGCATDLGRAPLIARDPALVGIKLLRPGARARSCRTTVLGVPVDGDTGTFDDALARLLAVDGEGNVVTDLVLREKRLTTGLVNRRCIELRGDLGRSITTLTLPMPEGHPPHDSH